MGRLNGQWGTAVEEDEVLELGEDGNAEGEIGFLGTRHSNVKDLL